MGDGGTTGTIAVPPGTHTVSESGAPGTSLADYDVEIVCRDEGPTGVGDRGASDPSVVVQVRSGSAIVCVVTNTAEQEPDERVVSPVLECVVFNDGSPDVAVWGYLNRRPIRSPIPVGDPTASHRRRQDRGQPRCSSRAGSSGVFQTPFQAESTTLDWSLSGRTATASARSQRCTATARAEEGRRALDRPGRLRSASQQQRCRDRRQRNDDRPDRRRRGRRNGQRDRRAGTNLADYESSVECTRNGVVAVSVPGTKVDGAVANGDVVVCTFTNRRIGVPPEPPEPPAAARSPRNHRSHRNRLGQDRCSISPSPSRPSRRSWLSAGGSRGR